MNGKGMVSSLDSILQWVTRIVMLNLLWFLFSLLGLFLLGIFPATVAALGISKRWINGEQDISLYKTFKKNYKEEFKIANIIGWIFISIGVILFINYRVIVGTETEFWIGTIFGFYFIVFLYSITVVWSFPLLIHYKNNWFQYLKIGLIIGLVKLHYTVGIYSAIIAIVYLSLRYPGVIPFFSMAIIAVIWYWLCSRVFKQIDKKLIIDT